MRLMDARRPRLKVGRGSHGLGVRTTSTIVPGSLVLEFHGPRLREAEVVDFAHSLQIGHDLYLGRSGGADDYVNHSCDPSCGLVERDDRFLLIALRRILAGSEITFDYSTSMADEPWSMDCHCGTRHCRGRVEGFWQLPHTLRKRFLTRGLVPHYVIAARPGVAPRSEPVDPSMTA